MKHSKTKQLIEAIRWPEHEFEYDVPEPEPDMSRWGDEERLVLDPKRTDRYVNGPLEKAFKAEMERVGVTDFDKDLNNSNLWEFTFQGKWVQVGCYFDWNDMFQVMIYTGDNEDELGNPETHSYVTEPFDELVGDPSKDARLMREKVESAFARFNNGDMGDF